MYKVVIYEDDQVQETFEGDVVIYSVTNQEKGECYCASLVDARIPEIVMAYAGAHKVLENMKASYPVLHAMEEEGKIEELLDASEQEWHDNESVGKSS